jgi:hypothetical protein
LKANLISQYHLWAYIGILERQIFVSWCFWDICLALAPIFHALNKRETVKCKCRQKKMACGYWDETDHADLLLKFGDGDGDGDDDDDDDDDDDIVTYLLKARTVKPAETIIGRERLCEHVRC